MGAAFVLGIMVAVIEPTHAEQSTPISVVEDFHRILLDVMQKSDRMGYQDRHNILGPVIEREFDAAFMSKITSGAFWKDMSAEEQAALTETFRNFTIANYAARFNGYSGQSFETLGEKDVRRDIKMVQTRLVKKGGDFVELDYLLRPHGESWAIFDIIPEGKFSELATRRSEFAPVLRDKGVPGLLKSLKEKIANLEESDESG